MTTRALQVHYLSLAEAAQDKAFRRKAQITESCSRDMHIKWMANQEFYASRNFEHELAQRVGTAVSTDPLWKTYVADHQWYMQKANMYGSDAMNELLERLIGMIAPVDDGKDTDV